MVFYYDIVLLNTLKRYSVYIHYTFLLQNIMIFFSFNTLNSGDIKISCVDLEKKLILLPEILQGEKRRCNPSMVASD